MKELLLFLLVGDLLLVPLLLRRRSAPGGIGMSDPAPFREDPDDDPVPDDGDLPPPATVLLHDRVQRPRTAEDVAVGEVRL